MCKIFRVSGVFFFLIAAFLPKGEAQFMDPRKAEEFFDKGNYLEAMKLYKKLIEQSPEKAEYYRRVGVCYLRTFKDRTSAAQYLKKASKREKHKPEVWYYLGKAYMMQDAFKKAMKNFTKYQANSGLIGGKDDVAHLQKQCRNGMEMVKDPLDVTFKNLGDTINTPYPDYYPFVAKDGSRLVYTARRRRNEGGGKEFDGYYASDIWVLNEKENGKGFQTPENAGRRVNSKYDEQAVGLSDDGQQMFVYIDRVKKRGTIYKSQWESISFGRMKELDEGVNREESLEFSASISADRKTLFFTSNREGGEGGRDLWMTRKLPMGKWAKPQNLGERINTKHNEGFPTLSKDNETLYFCSQGHSSMGGYDIFKAEWNPQENTWSEPQNLGYPINDGTDNRTISFTEDDRSAYISTFGKGGHGSLDLYKVIFEEVANEPVIFKVKLPVATDSGRTFLTSPRITVFDENFKVHGRYSANENSSSYTLALPPGKYTMEIRSEKYPLYEEKIRVTKVHQKMGLVQKRVKLSEVSKKEEKGQGK